MDKIICKVIGIVTLSILLIGITNICMNNHWYTPRITVKEAYYKYNPEAKSLSISDNDTNIISIESEFNH